jgi:elongation factor P
MGMLEYNEAVERKYIVLEGQPYEVLHSHVFRKQQRKPVNATKLKNLITGKVAEHSFHQAEKVEEANITSKKAKYLYTNRGEFCFCDPENPAKRYMIADTILGTPAKFLKPNSIIDVLVFHGEDDDEDDNGNSEGKIIGAKIPIKAELLVKEAAPAVRGDTVTGATKQVVLETGAIINVPMFVNQGDIISINTETEQYVERITKK